MPSGALAVQGHWMPSEERSLPYVAALWSHRVPRVSSQNDSQASCGRLQFSKGAPLLFFSCMRVA